MKKIKKILGIGAVMTTILLCGCKEEVVTVADIQEVEGQAAEYIEVQEFVIKEKEEENNRENVQHCAVMIPVGYYESDKVPGMYVHEKAPLDSSNVYFTASEGEKGIVSESLTKQQYEEIIEQAYKDSGKSVNLQIDTFEEVDMDGVPAYKIRSFYENGNHKIQQLTYMILAENTYTVTYSQSEGDELMADFAISDAGIKLVIEDDKMMASSSK